VETDSVSLLRWDRESGEIRSLLNLDGTDRAVETVRPRNGGANETFTFLVREPFSKSDEWGVVGGDRIVIVRVEPFRIEVRDLEGALLDESGPIPIQRVRVTEYDRERLRQREGEAGIDWTLPEYKPTIVDGSAVVSPDGYLWVQLHRDVSTGDDVMSHAVISRSGAIVAVTALPDSGSLVGLGMGAAYFATVQESGLTTVSRREIRYP
jgi:hypothetical protein